MDDETRYVIKEIANRAGEMVVAALAIAAFMLALFAVFMLVAWVTTLIWPVDVFERANMLAMISLLTVMVAGVPIATFISIRDKVSEARREYEWVKRIEDREKTTIDFMEESL